MKYRKILKQMELEGDDDPMLREVDGKYKNMSMQKRALVNQEDALCVICNNGDYEDEDMIVFCGNCNVPVHQSCYGIETLPEGDWICYNCELFGFKRGLMVPCLLCPKKGGALKPTNIFTTNEHFKKYCGQGQRSRQKKKPLSAEEEDHSVYEEESLNYGGQGGRNGGGYVGQNREDKNLSLAVILQREFDFQLEQRETLEKRLERGEHTDQLPEIELHFDLCEREQQQPEDYAYFL